jgi:predicted transcriptional regulator
MPRFGDLEAAIMDAVWAESQPVRVRAVLERLNACRAEPLAYTTVQTVMDILWRKRWLSRAKDGRVNLYEAASTRQDYVSGLMNEALSAAEDRTTALVNFVEQMDADEVSALRSKLAEARSKERER